MTPEEIAKSLLALLEKAARDYNTADAALVFRSPDGKSKAVMLAAPDRAVLVMAAHQQGWELAGIIVASVVEGKLAMTVLPSPKAKAWAGKFLQDCALAVMVGKTHISASANA